MMFPPAQAMGDGAAPLTLKDQRDAAIDETDPKAAANPDFYLGPDWWQVSDADEEVCRIDSSRWPRLMTGFYRYEACGRR